MVVSCIHVLRVRVLYYLNIIHVHKFNDGIFKTKYSEFNGKRELDSVNYKLHFFRIFLQTSQ